MVHSPCLAPPGSWLGHGRRCALQALGCALSAPSSPVAHCCGCALLWLQGPAGKGLGLQVQAQRPLCRRSTALAATMPDTHASPVAAYLAPHTSPCAPPAALVTHPRARPHKRRKLLVEPAPEVGPLAKVRRPASHVPLAGPLPGRLGSTGGLGGAGAATSRERGRSWASSQRDSRRARWPVAPPPPRSPGRQYPEPKTSTPLCPLLAPSWQ